MPQKSARKDLSLKWLELFQICAQKGSLQAAAQETGLTVSTVSHHLRNLEDHLGVELLNHSRRPMVPTKRGRYSCETSKMPCIPYAKPWQKLLPTAFPKRAI